jgi:hypothetical protein
MPENSAWQLEDFVDSLVVSLDKTRQTLAVKSINNPLSYTVKELALDLNIFPSYDGDHVRFVTAQPGQEGASKVSIQLNSITDQQVRATTKTPGKKDEVQIDEIDVDPKTKKQLRKLGVTSLQDLEQIERKNVDIKKVADTDIDYSKLANQIRKTRRDRQPPTVTAVSLSYDEGRQPFLWVRGQNLAVDPKFSPVAVVNRKLAEVMSSSDKELKIALRDDSLAVDNEVILTCDPFAVLKLNVKQPEREHHE